MNKDKKKKVEKYMSIEVEFHSFYKNVMTYVSETLGLTINATPHYRGSFDKIMSLSQILEEAEYVNVWADDLSTPLYFEDGNLT